MMLGPRRCRHRSSRSGHRLQRRPAFRSNMHVHWTRLDPTRSLKETHTRDHTNHAIPQGRWSLQRFHCELVCTVQWKSCEKCVGNDQASKGGRCGNFGRRFEEGRECCSAAFVDQSEARNEDVGEGEFWSRWESCTMSILRSVANDRLQLPSLLLQTPSTNLLSLRIILITRWLRQCGQKTSTSLWMWQDEFDQVSIRWIECLNDSLTSCFSPNRRMHEC